MGEVDDICGKQVLRGNGEPNAATDVSAGTCTRHTPCYIAGQQAAAAAANASGAREQYAFWRSAKARRKCRYDEFRYDESRYDEYRYDESWYDESWYDESWYDE